MLKSVRRFWKNKGWDIAIKKKEMICPGNEVKITKTNDGKAADAS